MTDDPHYNPEAVLKLIHDQLEAGQHYQDVEQFLQDGLQVRRMECREGVLTDTTIPLQEFFKPPKQNPTREEVEAFRAHIIQYAGFQRFKEVSLQLCDAYLETLP